MIGTQRGVNLRQTEPVLGALVPILRDRLVGDAVLFDEPIEGAPGYVVPRHDLFGCHHRSLTHTASIAENPTLWINDTLWL